MQLDLDALERTMAETIDVFEGLDGTQFTTPTACEGWTVHTVLAHLTVALAAIAGQDSVPLEGDDIDFEAAVDVQAKTFAERPPNELIDIFKVSAPATIEMFRSLPEDVLDMPVPMGSAGSYPLSHLAGAITFDQTCHVRLDVLAPRGPVVRELAPVDDARMAATISWLVGGIPQMTTDEFRARLTDAVAVVLTGPGATSFGVSADGSGVTVGDPDGHDVRATIESSTTDFLLWGTGREDRHGRMQVTGDTAFAASVLDEFRVF